jgi:hypothetical protein
MSVVRRAVVDGLLYPAAPEALCARAAWGLPTMMPQVVDFAAWTTSRTAATEGSDTKLALTSVNPGVAHRPEE